MKPSVEVAPPIRADGSAELLQLVGGTPLLALSRLSSDDANVRLFAKAEWFNPGGSVKDRAAASIIADAEATGRIRPGVRLLDASSGNTGVAYAMIAAARGYPLTVCIPKSANPQVLGLLSAYGAEVVATDPLQGSDGAIREARRLAAEHPDTFLYLDQYHNPANWQAHFKTTAVEIWEQTAGAVTHFVAGLGTTGTLIGTTRRLKLFAPSLRSIAVQPDAALHGLEGLKHLDTAMVPGIYDPSVPDETMFIATEDAYDAAQQLAERDGLVIGPSSGAALAASLRLAKRLASSSPDTPATIVTIFPDSGARYVAEGFFALRHHRLLAS